MSELESEKPKLSDVGYTGLVTAYLHALESRSDKPLLQDPRGEAIADRLRPILAASPFRFLQRLTRGRKDSSVDKMVTRIALRARKYDEYARDFAVRHPGGCVVNLGCGLDTRFWRIDDGRLHFFDLDLPETIAFKRQFVEEADRYHLIALSVLNHQWMDRLSAEPGPFLFLAEGLFTYLPSDEVRALVLSLQARFPGSELVCEVMNSLWLKPPLKWIITAYVVAMGWPRDTEYHFGIRDSREMEAWIPGLHFLEEWFYLNEDEPRLARVRRMYKWKLISRDLWTVRYLLGPKNAPPK